MIVTNRTGHVLYQQKPNEQRSQLTHAAKPRKLWEKNAVNWVRGIGKMFHFWAKDIQKNGSIDLPSGNLT